ncbi:PRC-barrel domain-containing protein [Aquisalimonas lutea]|uniref:PRC-barrel domain-containing protein n=1 Tax=Aquisalimonas lutea TaxID=1327750 RepID=UPI0025B3147F|nr:PRC-barrel domain-containing protein [Aquisalimonas lutea]MDN3519169.1 PRC-barrel domain-containing protein [Aquisalimonas lutea]
MQGLKVVAAGVVLGTAMTMGTVAMAADEDTREHGSKSYISSMPQSAVHASDLIGTSVRSRGSDGEEIGSVTDLVLDRHGQVTAVVVGVGGFLGVGEKEVAISWDRTELASGADGGERVVRIDADQSSLEEAPEYQSGEDSGMSE